MIRQASCFSVALLLALAGCTSNPPGVVSVEARGGIYSSDVAEAILLALVVIGSGASGSGSSGSNGKNGGNSGQNGDPEWEHEIHSSYGWQGAISTDYVDIIGGVDERWFDDRGAEEWNIGLRKRFSKSSDPAQNYLMVVARHGSDLRTDRGSQDYDGVGFGGGVIAPLDEHWFLDFSLVFESTWNPIEIDGDDRYLFSAMLNVGLGFSP